MRTLVVLQLILYAHQPSLDTYQKYYNGVGCSPLLNQAAIALLN